MTETEIPALKPCPFCGGEAEIERYGDRRQSTIYQCTSCSCSLETSEEWGHGTDWNRRHTVEAQPVPEDWQLVPTEITTDMMGAFHHAKRVEKFVPDIWSAMLSAAPTPPSRAEVTPEQEPTHE